MIFKKHSFFLNQLFFKSKNYFIDFNTQTQRSRFCPDTSTVVVTTNENREELCIWVCFSNFCFLFSTSDWVEWFIISKFFSCDSNIKNFWIFFYSVEKIWFEIFDVWSHFELIRWPYMLTIANLIFISAVKTLEFVAQFGFLKRNFGNKKHGHSKRLCKKNWKIFLKFFRSFLFLWLFCWNCM